MRVLFVGIVLFLLVLIPNTFFVSASAPISFGTQSEFQTGNNPRNVITGDFNNDGKLDLLTANFGGGTVSLLLGNGDGSFRPKIDISAGDAAHSLATGDFNKDGKLDVAVTNAANSDNDSVSILLGNGDGTFRPRTSYPTQREPLTVVTGDFNQDSNLDLAVVNQRSDSVSIFLGNEQGAFSSTGTFPTGSFTPHSLAAADFNGDGKLDLAVTRETARVGIMIGTGTGSFGPPTDFLTGNGPSILAAKDFNHDNIIDLAITNAGDNTISVLLGNGDGTFRPKADYPTGHNPFPGTVGDFDNDGNIDLVTVNTFDNRLSVLTGNGDGTFNPRVDLETGSFPHAGSSGDFNGDGKLDIAVANYNAHTTSVLLNQTSVNLPDSDGDGIPDEWETHGYWHNGQFVNLPALGANPNHKDIFVEVDYMVAADHSHKPDSTAINMIIQSFASVPNNLFAIPNPDGLDGITLHVIIDEPLTHVNQLGSNNGDNYNWSDFTEIKRMHFNKALSSTFHYCIFAHDGPHERNGRSDSGIARDIPSTDFLVSLGSFTQDQVGTTLQQAGTFMHELGHNLGLRHGGFQDRPNYKPNYLSVMNYSFQLEGLYFNSARGHFDYSRFVLPPLNEDMNLDESIGLNGGVSINGYGTKWFCNLREQVIYNANGVIDWNCNGNKGERGVSTDINQDGFLTTLVSFADWTNLNFKGGAIGSGIGYVPPMETLNDELDIETARTLLPAPPVGLIGRFEDCGIYLNWLSAGPGTEFSYKVYRSTGGQPFMLILSTTSTSLFDSNLDPAKTHTYYVTVVNALGTESNSSDPVIIKGASDLITELIALVENYNLDHGLANSLTSKLTSAGDLINQGNKSAACNKVQAFIFEVGAQSDKKLTETQANSSAS